MKKRTLILAVLVALTFCFLSAGFVPAAHAATRSTKLSTSVVPSGSIRPFINQVPCNNSQFLDIGSNVQGPSCFANDGYIGFRIDGATSIHAGNNDGWVRCYGGSACGSGKFYYFSAYYTYQLGGALITQVDITGQG